jgi:hypothetical protein
MNSEQIQAQVYNWALNHGFTAPYGVLAGEQVNRNGKKYRGVTFGYARTRDVEVQIYNRNFIVVRDSATTNQVFKSVDGLQQFLDTL